MTDFCHNDSSREFFPKGLKRGVTLSCRLGSLHNDWRTIFEPRHEISNNVVCATSKASDQPAHMRSLIRAFASRLNVL